MRDEGGALPLFHIRPLALEDVVRLPEIDTSFISDAVLQVEKTEDGLGVSWRLAELPLSKPSKRGWNDAWGEETAQIIKWLENERGIHLLAERSGRPVGLLNVEPEDWNQTARVWNILVDRDHRGCGLGRTFIERAVAWARERGFRALWLEAQNDNINACRFYKHVGFYISGIRDDFYTNDDIGRGQVAIFWSYHLT